MIGAFAAALLADNLSPPPAASHAVLAAKPGHVARAFRPAIGTLHAAAFPVLLPTTFGDLADLERDRLFAPVQTTPHHYHVEVAFAPDCGGANVCTAGAIDGYDATYERAHQSDAPPASPRTPDADDRRAIAAGRLILDRRTVLAGAHTGWYTESPSGADDGGNSSLRWNEGGIVYSLITRISDRATLVRIANSAIRNGPIFAPRRPIRERGVRSSASGEHDLLDSPIDRSHVALRGFPMQFAPYLFFNGTCEEALEFYGRVFGGKTVELNRFEEAPMAADLPADARRRVMHATFSAPDVTFMASDGDADAGGEMNRVTLALGSADEAEGRRLFDALADGGNVTMPYTKQFWGASYGTLVDRYGIRWMVNAGSG